MRVAIPIWQGRVSPVFDVAGQLLLVDADNALEQSRREETLADEEPGRRAERLADLGVTTLVCGAISQPLLLLLEAKGIEVVSRVCGEVDEVLAAFLAGGLCADRFAMPGCCGRMQRGRQGRCRGGRTAGRHRRHA